MTNIEFERPPPIDTRFRSQNHLLAKFTVDAFDKDGKYLGRSESDENDLLLNNLGYFISGILALPLSTGVVRFSTMTTTGGVNVTICTYSSSPLNTLYVWFGMLSNYSSGISIGSYIGVGTSGVAPARGDFELNALLTLAGATGANYGTTSNQVVVSGAVTVSNAATIAEAGVYLKLCPAVLGASVGPYLMAHDLVTPNVAVPSMGSASVNWALQI